MSVNIHGKEYITVSERVMMAHKDLKEISITTEVVPSDTMIIVKATVTTPKGIFTGMSAANPTKMIEKQSPYEVAETSAIGRALGFAGYGIVDGIATADEIKKVEADPEWMEKDPANARVSAGATKNCVTCGKAITPAEASYSLKFYKEELCRTCQTNKSGKTWTHKTL